jgi:manganese oxidase
MSITRRNLLGMGSAAAGAAAMVRARRAQAQPSGVAGASAAAYTPVVAPNGATMTWTMNQGVKEFHLNAEIIKHEVAPGMVITAWGYNGRTPGPVIEAVEGDRVRFFVHNKLRERTSLHWHGIFLPNGMDGVAGLNQPHIEPGETYVYEFTLRQHGVFMYHPHSDEMVQMAMGMMGFFVIHPRAAETPRVDRHF